MTMRPKKETMCNLLNPRGPLGGGAKSLSSFPQRAGGPELAPCLMVAGCRGIIGPDPSAHS